jgi:hypothetical protein
MKILELEIHGKNELNRIILLELNNIYPQLEKYVDKRIATQTGKSSKFNINFLKTNPIPLKDGFAQNSCTFLNTSSSSLWLKVKICINGGNYEDKTSYCEYFESDVYLGSINNNVLILLDSINEITERTGINKVINIQEEQTKIKNYKEMKKELDLLKSSINVNEYFYKY